MNKKMPLKLIVLLMMTAVFSTVIFGCEKGGDTEEITLSNVDEYNESIEEDDASKLVERVKVEFLPDIKEVYTEGTLIKTKDYSFTVYYKNGRVVEFEAFTCDYSKKPLERNTEYVTFMTPDSSLYCLYKVSVDKKHVYETGVSPETDWCYFVEDVPFIPQNPNLPSGCESTALCEVLSYYGFNIDKSELARNYLDYSAKADIKKVSPYKKFVGSPFESTGYGCFAPVIKKEAEAFLKDYDRWGFEVYDITGKGVKAVYEQIRAGRPVITWVTFDATDRVSHYKYDWGTWISSEHCVVVEGYDDNNVYISDPQRGHTAWSRSSFEKSYKLMGSQGIVIY